MKHFPLVLLCKTAPQVAALSEGRKRVRKVLALQISEEFENVNTKVSDHK